MQQIIIFSHSFSSILSPFHVCQPVCLPAFIISLGLEELVPIMQLLLYPLLTPIPKLSPEILVN